MNGQIDSLDHIGSSIPSYTVDSSRNKALPLEESSYRLIPTSQNQFSSFGAGGTLSQVVDPEFRPPTTSSFSHQQAYTPPMYPNQNVGQPTNLGPYVSPIVQQQLNQNTNQPNAVNSITANQHSNTISINVPSYAPKTQTPLISESNNHSSDFSRNGSILSGSMTPSMILNQNQNPFGRKEQFLSFSDLARPSPTYSTNTITDTLNEYGPPQGRLPTSMATIPLPPAPKPVRVNEYSGHMGNSRPATVSGRATEVQSSSASYSRPTNEQASVQPRLNPPQKPTEIASTPFQSTIATVPTPNPPSGPKTSTDDSRPIYSPPVDKTSSKGSHDRHQASTSANHRIPKKNTITNTNEKYDDMDMVTLVAKYRELEIELKRNQVTRSMLERAINDLTRSSHGKNLEQDPIFCDKKQQLKEGLDSGNLLRAEMKKIQEKLWTKFQVHVDQNPSNNSGVKRPLVRQRAKMSTAPDPIAHKPNLASLSTKKSRLLNLVLDLDDSNTWCQACDTHFDSLKEYFDHLHHRTHAHNSTKNCTPWRISKNQIDKRKTWDIFKSVFAKIDNEQRTNNFAKVYERIINPKSNEKLLKDRERGKFSSSDQLMKVKGYDYLIPITGFFCSLCDRTLCDKEEAEQHLRGYTHNFNHARIVALNPSHEKQFRERLSRSYLKQFNQELNGPRENDDSTKEKNSSDKAEPSTSGHQAKDDANPKQLSTSTSKTPVSSAKTTNTTTATNVSLSFTPSTIVRSTAVTSTLPSTTSWLTNSSTTSSTAHAGSSTTSGYKKSTSHIVDDHETLVDKFGKTHTQIIPTTSKPKHNDAATVIKKRTPEIVPLDASRSKPSALKRLKTVQSGHKKVSTPILTVLESESDDDEQVYSDARDDNYLDEKTLEGFMDDDDYTDVHFHPGDELSPFPDMYLSVTGNIHVRTLRDPRLKQEVSVRLTRLNMEDYKDMLFDSSSLWSRVQQMMAKKESDQWTNTINNPVLTSAVFIDQDGDGIPVDIENDRGAASLKKRSETDKVGLAPTTSEPCESGSSKSDSEGNEDKPTTLSFLDDFFYEK